MQTLAQNKKAETKKLVAFGVIISLFTSVYTTFLGTIIRQGFFTEDFFSNWLALLPKAYLAILPFVLITGPLVRNMVERIFKNAKS
jgi:hypothetical protein